MSECVCVHGRVCGRMRVGVLVCDFVCVPTCACEDINSLTMKFLGSRVAASSSKNFLFDMPTADGAPLPL